jgi:hypothetical protein
MRRQRRSALGLCPQDVAHFYYAGLFCGCSKPGVSDDHKLIVARCQGMRERIASQAGDCTLMKWMVVPTPPGQPAYEEYVFVIKLQRRLKILLTCFMTKCPLGGFLCMSGSLQEGDCAGGEEENVKKTR